LTTIPVKYQIKLRVALDYSTSIVLNVIEGIYKKQQFIGSLYPELMTFEENELRIKKTNEVVELVATFNAAFQGSKKRQAS
jgi:hypothetical protein